MPLLYNINKRQIVNLDPDRVASILTTQEAKNFMPVNNQAYTVIHPDTGESEEVRGDTVRQKLHKGYTLSDTEISRMQNLVRSRHTSMGAFGKKALDTALTLGFGEALRNKPENRVQELYNRVYEKEFGTARTLGDVTGFLGPLLVGGVGAAVAKTATKKGISKLISKAPSAVGIRQIDKLGQATGKAAVTAAKKFGLKDKRALALISGAGKATGWAAGDTALFATRRGVEAGREADYDRSFNIREAISAGGRAAPEIFSTSFLFSGGALLGFGGVKLAYKGTKAVVGGTGRFIGEKVKNADFAHLIRKEFFNTPNSQAAIQDLKNKVSSAYKFLGEYLPADNLYNLWKNLPESIKTTILSQQKQTVAKTAIPLSFLRKNVSQIIKNSSEKDILLIMSKFIKDKLGKIPRNRAEAYHALNSSRQELGTTLNKIRNGLLNEYKSHLSKANQLKKDFGIGDKKNVWKAIKDLLDTTDVRMYNIIDELSFLEKEKISEIISKIDFLDFGINIKKYIDIKKPVPFSFFTKKKASALEKAASVNKLLSWLVIKASKNGEVKKISDIFDIKNIKSVDDLWIKAGIPKKIIKPFRTLLKDNVNQYPEIFTLTLDIFKIKNIFNKKIVSLDDIRNLYDITKRFSANKSYQTNTSLRKINDYINKEFSEAIAGKYSLSSEIALSALGSVKRAISVFKKATISKGVIQKINTLEKLIKRGEKDLNIFDINQIKEILDELSKFSKTKNLLSPERSFRKLYTLFSNLEDKMFLRLSKKYGPDIIKNKGEYSLIKTVIDSLDQPVKSLGSGGNLNFRDIMFAVGGASGGGYALAAGNPILALAIAGGAWAGARATSATIARGQYFLHVADKIDNFSSFVSKQKDTFNKYSKLPKLKSFLSSVSDLKGVNVNTLTLSHLLLDKPENDFHKFMYAINQTNPNDIITNQDGELHTMLAAIGGDEVAGNAAKKITDLKHFVLQNLPQGTMNPLTGKKTYSSFEKNKFMRHIQAVVSPEKFLSDFKNGQLSSSQVQIFSQMYPEHYNSLVITLTEGLREGTLNLNLRQRKSLDTLLGLNSLSFLFHHDMIKREEEQKKTASKSGGRKFSAYTQPSKNQRAINF